MRSLAGDRAWTRLPPKEIQQPGGIEARDYLRSLLPDGAEVAIVPAEKERYGRTVAEVWNDAIASVGESAAANWVRGQGRADASLFSEGKKR